MNKNVRENSVQFLDDFTSKKSTQKIKQKKKNVNNLFTILARNLIEIFFDFYIYNRIDVERQESSDINTMYTYYIRIETR